MKKQCGECGAEISVEGAEFCPDCGAKVCEIDEDKAVESAELVEVQTLSIADSDESKYTGGAFGNFFSGALVAIVSVLSLFFAAPAMICWRERYVAKRTYINGMRLTFDGKGGQLFGRFMLWTLLSVITFGIYYVFFMSVAVEKWKVKHTHFDGVKSSDGVSEFDGGALGFFGTNFIANLVTTVTLSLGYYWAHCYVERWYCRHTKIDGCRLYFDGTGMQFFGKRLLWTFLTIVTLGVYSFWLTVKSKQWTVLHTRTNDPLPELDPTEAARIIEELKKTKPGMDMVIAGDVFAFLPMVIFSLTNFFAINFGDMPMWAIPFLTSFCCSMSLIGLILSICSVVAKHEPRALALVGIIGSVSVAVQILVVGLLMIA